jgi:hypothetical protein
VTKILIDEPMKQVPLHEHLAKVPADARLVIEDADGFGTSYIPVGRLCQEAATVIRQALADAALDKMAENARELGLSYEPAHCEAGPEYCPQCEVEQPAQQSAERGEPVATKLHEAKQNFERNFGPHAMADWIYSDLLEWLGDTTPPAPAQEPVALAKAFNDGVLEGTLREREHWLKQPPAPAQPLTDEQIEKLREKTFSTGNPYCPVDSKSMRKAARAIEAAHGITKGNT